MRKKKKTVLICVMVLFLCFIGWWIWAVSANKIVHDDIYTEYESTEADASKVLLVYQPGRTSFSEEVATDIAKGLNDNGYNVTLTTANDKLTRDLSGYEMVVFGTPIYMSMYSSVIGDYVADIENYGDAKIVFYCTGMLENTVEFDTMKQLFDGENLTEVKKISKSMYLEDKEVAYNFGKSL